MGFVSCLEDARDAFEEGLAEVMRAKNCWAAESPTRAEIVTVMGRVTAVMERAQFLFREAFKYAELLTQSGFDPYAGLPKLEESLNQPGWSRQRLLVYVRELKSECETKTQQWKRYAEHKEAKAAEMAQHLDHARGQLTQARKDIKTLRLENKQLARQLRANHRTRRPLKGSLAP